MFGRAVMRLLLSWLLLTSYDLLAAQHALLIGVGDYLHPENNLTGPPHDVAELQQVLPQWQFPAKNIRTLLNQQATRANILAALNTLLTATQPGDQVFIYFSGHGTSAYNTVLPVHKLLPDHSGALVPYDFPADQDSAAQAANLIIGSRDLRPVLERFDQGQRNVFVVIDSCFSGNAVRSLFNPRQHQARYRTLPSVTGGVVFTDEATGAEESAYPYNNVLFVGAASDREKALDLDRHSLLFYDTLSSKPQGAFTDALLRVLRHDLLADHNRDGISYQELYDTISDFMDQRGYGHTPQLLPGAAQDALRLTSKKLFGSAAPPVATTTVLLPSDRLRLHIGGEDRGLSQRLAALPDIELTPQQPQLRFYWHDQNALFLTPAWDLVLQIDNATLDDVVTRLQRQVWINKLLNLPPGKANFELRMDLQDGGVALQDGQELKLAIRAGQPVQLLLFNINSQGEVELFYPARAGELAPLQALNIPEGFQLFARPPYGSDQLVAFGFSQHQPLVRQFMEHFQTQARLAIDAPLMRVLIDLLRNEDIYRRAVQRIITVAALPKQSGLTANDYHSALSLGRSAQAQSLQGNYSAAEQLADKAYQVFAKANAVPEWLSALRLQLDRQLENTVVNAADIQTALHTMRNFGVEPEINLRIHFGLNQALPDARGLVQITELGRALQEFVVNDRYLARIVGHTDAQGAAAYNQRLSEQRAHSVIQLLRQQFAELRGKLVAVGRGEQELRYNDDSDAAHRFNRRVEVELYAANN